MTAIPKDVLKWGDMVVTIAEAHSLDSSLVLAVIWQESAGDPYAYRYEEGWCYFYDPKAKGPLYVKGKTIFELRKAAHDVLGSTEFHAQSASYGLMQVMGSVAREHGVDGWLTRLCDWQCGLVVGCKHLAQKTKRAEDLRQALKLYNGSYEYADKVLGKMEMLRREEA